MSKIKRRLEPHIQHIAKGFKPPWKKSMPNADVGGRKVLPLAAGRLLNVLKRLWDHGKGPLRSTR
jgi:hypothetical protein